MRGAVRPGTAVGVCLTAVALLAGCGSGGGDAAGTGTPSGSGGGTGAPSASASATPTPTPTPTLAERQAAVVHGLSSQRLAAQVYFPCVDYTDTATLDELARRGVGGITLLGTEPPADLGDRLAHAVSLAPRDGVPIIASDEEGGLVQRLAPLLGALPNAETMGTWSRSQITSTAADYGAKLRDLGISMDLAPVADLQVPGHFIGDTHRSFSADPESVGTAVTAWMDGMWQHGVGSVLKHWPGHGSAGDTHVEAATVPPWTTLQGADLLPFTTGIAAQRAAGAIPMVMVAHVTSEGLTEPGVPASQSPNAMAELRKRIGDDGVIVTDSLSMAAPSSARGLTESQAVVAALTAGADWAMACSLPDAQWATLDAVAAAIDDGTLDREALERSAVRIRVLQQTIAAAGE